MKPRDDDFKERRQHLDHMSDQDLKAYFYKLTNQMIDPLLELAYEYTSPAIERSVLMRMGFSSLEAKSITDKLMEYQLLEHGAGHVVYRYSTENKVTIREAGMALLDSKNVEKMVEAFK